MHECIHTCMYICLNACVHGHTYMHTHTHTDLSLSLSLSLLLSLTHTRARTQDTHIHAHTVVTGHYASCVSAILATALEIPPGSRYSSGPCVHVCKHTHAHEHVRMRAHTQERLERCPAMNPAATPVDSRISGVCSCTLSLCGRVCLWLYSCACVCMREES